MKNAFGLLMLFISGLALGSAVKENSDSLGRLLNISDAYEVKGVLVFHGYRPSQSLAVVRSDQFINLSLSLGAPQHQRILQHDSSAQPLNPTAKKEIA